MVDFKCVYILVLSLYCVSFCDCVPLENEEQLNSVELSDAALEFALFQIEFNITYTSILEKMKRFEIFKETLKLVDLLNKNVDDTATYSITKFADRTPKEFAAEYAGSVITPEELSAKFESMEEMDLGDIESVSAPAAHDWREKNVVTPVKNQGRCGSCWAFSTCAVIEALHAIKYGKQINFSEQQLVDCDRRSNGCDGGWPDYAVQSIIDYGGLNTASSYGYEGLQGSCRFNKNNIATKVSDNKKLKNNENDQANYVGTTGPVQNAINAKLLQYYKGGIIRAAQNRCDRKPNAVNHAVVVIGYGTENNVKYWIVKNSWGTRWGENGYFRIERGENTCGIANYVSSPMVK